MRSLLALLAVVAAASLGALILGEYEMAGATPLVAGVLFGLILAEVAMSVVGRRPRTDGTTGRTTTGWMNGVTMMAVVAAVAAGAMVWAAWISSGRDWAYVPGEAWIGVGLAAAAGVGWIRGSRRRVLGSPRSSR